LFVPGSTVLRHCLRLLLIVFLLAVPEPIHHPGPISFLRQNPLQIMERTEPAARPTITAEPVAPAQPRSSAALLPSPLPVTGSTPHTRRPRVAIIIDDMGYNLELGRQLIGLGMALSFSFLPAAPHTRKLAELAHASGQTILAHLPMEPKNRSSKLEPVMLEVADSATRLQEKTVRMLAAVPQAAGANNHMGSRFSEYSQGMRQVLTSLGGHSLFFIDSSTSAASVGETIARTMAIPTARRRVFLDNDQQVEAVCGQLGFLAALAFREGQAIAIGHPNPGMLAALTGCAAQRLAGVELVGVDKLVH
jgi:polysaccharide deacetylase 2 family uncharacterized protein YibQ